MKLNIKGKYVFRQNGKVIFKGENIITTLGESFFLNRMINDNFNPIQYLCMGNSPSKPRKSDIRLGNETIRKKCVKDVDLVKKQIILTANFSPKELYGTTEIGVANDTVLISHDVYQKLDDNILTPTAGDVEVIYTFNLTTGEFKTGWVSVEETPGVYYIYEPNPIYNVFDNTGAGYKKVNSKSSLNPNFDGYYYDITSKNLYITTSDGIHPDNKEIIVQTK